MNGNYTERKGTICRVLHIFPQTTTTLSSAVACLLLVVYVQKLLSYYKNVHTTTTIDRPPSPAPSIPPSYPVTQPTYLSQGATNANNSPFLVLVLSVLATHQWHKQQAATPTATKDSLAISMSSSASTTRLILAVKFSPVNVSGSAIAAWMQQNIVHRHHPPQPGEEEEDREEK